VTANRATELCREALRRAVPALEAAPARTTSQHLRSWLVLYQLSEKQRWLEKLRSAVTGRSLARVPEEERGAWIRLCCDCWVIDAAGPFRDAVRTLLEALPPGAGAVPALLRNWRITGNGSYRLQALEQLPAAPTPGDFAAATAYRAAYHATGSPEHLDAARLSLGAATAADIPLRWWPLAWDVLDWTAADLVDEVAGWTASTPPAEEVVPAVAASCLPSLDLRVLWWDSRELQEGYVAEAVTFPYPALRLRFERMNSPGQVRFAPSLGGQDREALEDAGVIAPLLSHLVDEVDRQGVVNAARSRPGRGRPRR